MAIGKARKEKIAGQSRFLARLVTHFASVVNEKRRRIADAITESENEQQPPTTLAVMNGALAPGERIAWLIESVAMFYRAQTGEVGMEQIRQNFRVGFYVLRNDLLVPEYEFSLRDRVRHCFRSHEENEFRYRLSNNTNPSVVVRCLQEQNLIIIEDCVNEEKKAQKQHKPTFYLRKGQEKYLKSMFAFPIMLYGLGADRYRAAIVVDTDVRKFFRERDRENIKIFMEEVALRLNMEAHVAGLLERLVQGESNAHK